MSIVAILLLAVALAADAVSVAAASGAVCRGPRPVFRLAFHFGLFQALMPALGGLSGSVLHEYVAAFDHWIAFGLLAVIGVRMIAASFATGESEEPRRDPSRGLTLVGLSLATSIDAFGAGVGLGMTETHILLPCLTIGLVTGGLTILGIHLGRLLSRRVGPWAERLGGLVLVGLALKLLLTM